MSQVLRFFRPMRSFVPMRIPVVALCAVLTLGSAAFGGSKKGPRSPLKGIGIEFFRAAAR